MPDSFVTSWTPHSMRFSRQEYCSGWPFPSPRNLPDLRIEPASPALAGRFFTTELPGPLVNTTYFQRQNEKSPHHGKTCTWIFITALFTMKQFKRSSTGEMIYYVVLPYTMVHPYNWWTHPYHRGSVVKNLPANARDVASILWSRKFPRVAERFRPCVMTTAPVL